jgi:hypothetical protein
MNLTIALDEKQAGDLQKQASARRVSAEQLAGDLLKDALGRLTEEETWGALNRRRLDLIGKSRFAALTREEQNELEQLQAAMDRRLEPMDSQLLASARHFRQMAEAQTTGFGHGYRP